MKNDYIRTEVFINSLEKGNTPFLDELERKAKADNVPVIKKEMQSLLKVLIGIKKPKRVLEIGTAVGFSAILMAESGPEDMEIVTVENYEKRIAEAERNIRSSGYEDRIRLIKGDAAEVLPTLKEKFDMVFMDAAKGQYINFLPEVKRLLNDGGILVSDNCLKGGDILESRFVVERRDRTIHRRMRDYLYEVKHDDCLETAVLSAGDGITVSVKINEKA
ncbi:MAG: O-methyltransferase [Lachnospiraceae bacterium]|nr:O-methyltransferase [Lachnospiraceae bacterium]